MSKEVLDSQTFAEAITALKDRLKAGGELTIGQACEKAGVSRNALYVAMKPGKKALGPVLARKLAEACGCTKDEVFHITVLWLKSRYAPGCGATAGVMAPVFDLVDGLPKKRKEKIYRDMIDGYIETKLDSFSKK